MRDDFYRRLIGFVPVWSNDVTDTPERRELARRVFSGEPCHIPKLVLDLPAIPLPKIDLPPIPYPGPMGTSS